MIGVLLKHEVFDITGKQKYGAQCRALLHMKIPFTTRLDGSPCVANEAVKQSLGVQSSNVNETEITVDMEAL